MNHPTDAQFEADKEAVLRAVSEGKKVDPEVARRVREHSRRARTESGEPASADSSVRIIREMRGPLDQEQARELTLAQQELLRQEKHPRLTDPETGEVYVLLPEAEYERLTRRDA